MTKPPALADTARRLERASGALASQSVARMDETLPWFRSLPADQRSWIALVTQAGVAAFVKWLRDPGPPELYVTGDIFGAAPRDLARAVTLQQAIIMVKTTIDVLEEQTGTLAAPGEEVALNEAVLRYSREVAFAAATVYARAAENRGTWDARLQAMVVDALMRNDPVQELASQTAALGWTGLTPVAVAVGDKPDTDPEAALDGLARVGTRIGVDVLGSIHGERLVLVMAGSSDPLATVKEFLAEFGPGPVVVGHTMPSLAAATSSARAAEAGARAVTAWPAAPRPCAAADLLPERALSGDEQARAALIDSVYQPLAAAGAGLLETLAAYLDVGSSLEAAAKQLFVHPNTVRYRLRRISEVCGYSPTQPRDAFTLHLALVLGMLSPH